MYLREGSIKGFVKAESTDDFNPVPHNKIYSLHDTPKSYVTLCLIYNVEYCVIVLDNL